nr:MBG domain-containing protein [uncultured Flavobacterium sp.]
MITFFVTNESYGQKTWDGGAGTANWGDANNWNPNGLPAATDAVTIPDNFNVTVNVAAVCSSLTISSGANSNTITISGTNSLTISGALNIGAGSGNGDNKIIAVGTGTLSCASGSITDTTNNNRDSEITISSGTVNVTGNITMNGVAGRNAIRFSGSGILNIGGTISGGDFIASTSTVNYNAAGNQTVGTYVYNNLTLSGSGAKTVTGATINGKLSMQGTATAAGTTPTYGVSAVLEYKGDAAQTTSNVEFPNTLGADLIIDNTNGVTLNAAKTVTGFITLASGALIANNFNISLSGNWTNNGGSFTAGSSTVTFTGTSTIGGTVATTFFNLTKNTAVTVTNAVDGTTVSGTMSITSGTFIGNNSLTTPNTINVNNFSLTGGTFDSSNTTLAGIACVLAISGSYVQTTTSTFTNTGSGVTEVLFTGGGNTTYSNAYTTAVANWQYAIVHVANNTTLTLSTDLMQWGVVDTGATVDAGSTLVTGTNLLRAGTANEVWEINGTLKTAVTAGLNGSTTTTLVSTNTPVFTLGALSTIEYNSTSSQTVTSRADYANVTFTGNSTKTAAGSLSASKDLTINSNATFAAGSFTHNVAGNWINNGTFTPDTSTINFNGTSTISGSSVNTFNNISIAAASSLTGPASANINVQGNWVNNNTFNSNSGTVTFNSATAQSVSGATTFYNLSLTNSGVKTFSSVITTSANLSVASGTQANLGTGLTHSADSLTLGTFGTNSGTWGSTTSAATFKNDTYFGATTGVINVATNTAATPTVTPTVGTYTYNGLAQGPNTATNTGTGTSYTFSYVGVSGTVYGPSATQPTNAGDYTVTATVGDSADGFYRTANSSATSFSILLRVLTITADSDTKVYGQTYTVGSGSTAFTSSGLQNGETIGSITISSAGAVNTAAVGTYSIIPTSATGGTFTASNYSITYNNGTLTVNTALLTITADNASKCFGTTYALGTTAFTSIGLQNGETIGSVTLSSTGAASGAAVGSYAITASSATGGTFTATNYSITYNDGTLTVIASPNAPSGTNGAICSTGTVNLSASVNGGETVDWYDASSGGTLLLSNSTAYTTPSISSTTIYYAEARNTTTGCVSVTRTAVTATVYATFTSGAVLTTGETICYNGDPALIGNATIASGGDETITYKWQANGNDIPSSNSATYDPPAGLTATTTYTRFAKDNTCNTTFTVSTGSWTVTISNNNTWTGSVSTTWTNPANWSCGVVPASVSDVTIATATFYPIISSGVSINTLTLNSGTTLKVNSSYDLTVTDVISNNGTLTLENNANLIQVNDVANTGSGSTVVKRNSSAIMRLDYTLWSSPVTGQGLYAFSPFTFANRFYVYNTSTNTYSSVSGFNITGLNSNGVNGVDNNNVPFSPGLGYLIRMPNNHPTTPTIWTGTFTGTPNNGTQTVSLNNIASGQRFNLVGNPYPSPLDAIAFVTDTNNASNITGTLYFLRKTNSNFNSSYSTWTQGGFVTNGGAAVFDPNDVIQTGQGFIVETTATGSSLEFNNSMRINDHANQFFRSNNSIERNRIWLNATNDNGMYSQTMIGYITNATNDVDNSLDGKSIYDGDIALTSLIGTTPYAIQGRALPFDNNDVVPLSFRVANAGQYTIAIDHVDGLFLNGQDIFLRDNLTSVVHNLNTSAYSFASDTGTFDSRFEVLYQSPLGVTTPVFNANQVVVYKNAANDFVINSGNVTMASVKVFDIRGRLLLEKNGINNSETIITTGQANEVLLIQITSQDGLVVTKKVIR